MSNLYERVAALPVGTIFVVTNATDEGAPWMRGRTSDDGDPQIYDLMIPLVTPQEKPVAEIWRGMYHGVRVLYDPTWGGSEL